MLNSGLLLVYYVHLSKLQTTMRVVISGVEFVFIYLNAKLETLTKAVFGQAKIAMQKKNGPIIF